jgi:hypothetical protein
MENTSGISEKTRSSTPSIDERDLVMSMRKLDLIKELGFVMNNKFEKKNNNLYILIEKNKVNFNVFKIIYNKILI